MIIRLFIPFICLLLSGTAVAQLTKEEKKEWGEKAKLYVKDPESLKKFSEEKKAADESIKNLEDQVRKASEALKRKNDQVGELELLISRIRVDAAVTKAELEKIKAGLITYQSGTPKSTTEKKQPVTTSADILSGVVFKVQVGAFRNKDMSKYFDNNPNFGGEVGKEPSDPQRINIGIFRNYWEADTFKKYLREMGVKDAWIVPYRDGIRVEIKDVLDLVVTDQSPTQD